MTFLINNDKKKEKYKEIRKEIKNSIKKEFDSEPVYNENYLIVKIKSYNEKLNTNLYNSKITTEVSQFIC